MKLRYAIIFLVVNLFSTLFATAQIKCGADEVRVKLNANNNRHSALLAEMEADIRLYINNHPLQPSAGAITSANTLYYIPCVVHVMYDGAANANLPSASQITTAIDYMNTVFDGSFAGTTSGDMQIKFVLATKDPLNNATSGIERINAASLSNYSANGVNAIGTNGTPEMMLKNFSRWDSEKYYNIWVVNKIDGCNALNCSEYIGGYAYLPRLNDDVATAKNLDGTIILASQMMAGQKTLPHEIGHAFNLYHTFEGNDVLHNGANNCPVNISPNTDGDKCADTDPVTNPLSSGSNCRTGINSCTNTLYKDNTEKNYMNYTNCNSLFTDDQKNRMLATCNITQRASLATSWANDQGNYPAFFVAPKASSSVPVSTFINADQAGILSVTLNEKSVYSLNASQDGGYLDNSKKWYDAFELRAGVSYILTVNILNSNNASQLGVWVDYNNNGSFNSTNEQLFLKNNIAANITTISIPFTTASEWPGKNNFVRFRISQDLSISLGVPAISYNSTSLSYGQAEDYPVYLGGGVLPVTIINFDGKKITDAINLRWNTSTEINTASFDIERSYKSNTFTVIGNVIALNASGGASYSFKDADVANAGEYLYRLKMKDINGSFAYSNIIKFTMQEKKKMIVLGNPITNNIYLEMPYTTGNAMCRLLDATGRVIFTNNIKLNGTLYETINMNDTFIPSGIYVLEAIINGERFVEKVIKK
jgi:hypothetical protein